MRRRSGSNGMAQHVIQATLGHSASEGKNWSNIATWYQDAEASIRGRFCCQSFRGITVTDGAG